MLFNELVFNSECNLFAFASIVFALPGPSAVHAYVPLRVRVRHYAACSGARVYVVLCASLRAFVCAFECACLHACVRVCERNYR